MNRKKVKYLLYFFAFILVIAIVILGSEFLAIYKLGFQEVYISKYSLPSRTKITQEDLELIKIPKDYLNDNVYSSKEEIIDKYVRYDAFIPKGSLFYKDSIDDASSMKDYIHLVLNKNEVTYDLFVKDVQVNPAHLLKGMNINMYVTINRKEIVSDLLISNARIIGLYDIDNKEIKDNDSTLKTISIALNKDYVPYVNKAISIGEVSLLVGADVYDEKECTLNEESVLMKYLMVE